MKRKSFGYLSSLFFESQSARGPEEVVNLLVEFSNFVIDRLMECMYTDFSKAFDRVNDGLMCFDLMRSFSVMMLAWFWSHLHGRTHRDDFLSDVIYCHSSVPQGSHLGLLFFINNVDEVFCIFQHVSVLGYADDLKLFMTTESVDDCYRFQNDLDSLQEWCSRKKVRLERCKVQVDYF
jgi:lipid-A-disaccharide synthase-like uncharacterized protein